ncbi:hypothetical protein I5192_17535 [Ruegeria sp. SCSIO 43209]|uniref:hypothetical protein n=1 Tax=Ruegeria sp. SCSIO 43209 TaxID=2793010 RepID=UPI00147AE7CA|nr:hypothetical protein [Ruegeria sp. SCSIO 43209]UAB88997.1 hypothetical protein I5192_17535 [Ruegeria sp. SCSIO 43209]
MANDDLDTLLGTTLTEMVADIGRSVAQAAEQLSLDQLNALKNYPQELREMGIPPVFYHMQDVDVELKVVMEMTSTTEEGKRGIIGAFLCGPKLTQTDTLDASSASTMRMRFAPGPVDEGGSGGGVDGD